MGNSSLGCGMLNAAGFTPTALHIYKLPVNMKASVEQNAWELKQYIEELHGGSRKRVMLLGHSKGGVDAAAALSKYWHDLKDKVSGLAFVQSPYGGTPVASDMLREGQIADKETGRITGSLICKLIKARRAELETSSPQCVMLVRSGIEMELVAHGSGSL